MTFSYGFDYTVDLNWIRFETGDTNSSAVKFQDEEIAGALSFAGTKQAAVLMLLDGLIAKLSGTPGFTADWLKVDTSTMLRALIALRDSKAATYGLSGSGEIVSDGVHVYRQDSLQTEEPDYQD